MSRSGKSYVSTGKPPIAELVYVNEGRRNEDEGKQARVEAVTVAARE